MRVPEYPVGGTVQQANLPDARQSSVASPSLFFAGNLSPQFAELTGTVEKGLGVIAQKQQQESEQKAHEMAAGSAAKTYSDGYLQWEENFKQAQQSGYFTQPGDAQKKIKEFDTWMSDTVNQQPTQIQKEYTQRKLYELRNHFGKMAIDWESSGVVTKKVTDLTESVSKLSNVVFNDPKQYEGLLSQVSQQAIGLPPDVSKRLMAQAEKSFQYAAMNGAIRSNAQMAYDTLHESLYGGHPDTGEISRDHYPSTGTRLNNPGNIENSPVKFEGEVNSSHPRFKQFESPEAGIRAVTKNLLAYNDKHGLNTVEGIISRWAPASENGEASTSAYIDHVSSVLGVESNQPLNLRDERTMTALVSAITLHENGSSAKAYTADMIRNGVRSGLTGQKLEGNGAIITPLQNPQTQSFSPAKTGISFIDELPLQDKLHYMNAAENEVNRQMSINRTALEQRWKDQAAETETRGTPSDILQYQDFSKAYGKTAPHYYTQFVEDINQAATVRNLSAMPLDARSAAIEALKPQPGEGFAAQQERYKKAVEANQRIQAAINADPQGYFEQYIGQSKVPLDLTNPQRLGVSIGKRITIADAMSSQYGAPWEIFKKGEDAALKRYINQTPIDDRARALGKIVEESGNAEALQRAFEDKKITGDMTFAAGVLAAKNQLIKQTTKDFWSQKTSVDLIDAADKLLKGQDLLDQKSVDIPNAIKNEITQKLQAVYINQDTATKASAAALAMFAKLTYDSGEPHPLSGGDLIDKAIEYTSGKVYNGYGGKITLPIGMSADQFSDALPSALDEALKNTPNASVYKSWVLEHDGKLISLSDGEYAIQNGTHLLTNPDGSGVVVKVKP